MIAISPRSSRLARSFVRDPTRATPTTTSRLRRFSRRTIRPGPQPSGDRRPPAARARGGGHDRRFADPREHPRELVDARVVEQQLDHRLRAPAALLLAHRQLRVGECRDLGEMGDAQHLVLASEQRERAADGHPGFAAETGVDLVEHQGRRCLRENHPQGQHHARELAARRRLRERPGRLARVGREQERDLPTVAGIGSGIDLDVALGPPERQLAQPFGDRGGQHRRARAASRQQPLLGLGQRRERLLPAWHEGGPQLLGPLELRQPRRGLAREGLHVGDLRPVLAAQLAQALAAGPQLGQPIGVVDHLLGLEPRLVHEIGQLGLHGGEAGLERRTIRARRARPSPRRPRRSRARRRAPRGFETGPPGRRVGERVFLDRERLGLVGGAELGRFDLFELEAQEIELARAPGRRRPALEVVVDRAQLGPGGGDGARRARPAHRRRRRATRALLVRDQQRLLLVLPVQIDERAAVRGQLADGREPAVDVRAAPPARGERRGRGRSRCRRSRSARRRRRRRSGPRPALRSRRRARATGRPARRAADRAPRRAASCRRRSRR